MMALDNKEDSYPPEIIGYAEPWIVAPGDSVSIKVSCTEPEYRHRTVRLIQGIDLEHAPERAEEEIKEIPRGQQQGRLQTAQIGSYGYVANWGPPSEAEGLEISFYMQPWLLYSKHVQTLVSTLDPGAHTGVSICLDDQGFLNITVGLGSKFVSIATEIKPQEKTWSKFKVELKGRSIRASLTHIPFKVEPIPPTANFECRLDGDPILFEHAPLFIAASQTRVTDSSKLGHRAHVGDFFNGRIDGLALKTCGKTPLTLAKYDFALGMSSDRIMDTSGRGHNGILINAPTRAVRGHNWDGSESDWTRAKFGYGAIHFHEDDIDDAEWDTDFVITIPLNARSGAYAVEVEAVNGRDKDSITFFVRPTHFTSDNSKKVCLVFSTFTYLAYANERMYDATRPNNTDLGPSFDINKALKSADFFKMQRREDLGLSCYDRHVDGSGVCFSSSRRPILNVRPGYIMWGFSRPREFSADLMMVGFLEREGFPYEILTDHDLHIRGASALHGFNTVITGSHAEYPTLESYSAYAAFSRGGGNLMYLGGNGFYWVSAFDSARPHRLEVRRGDAGVRTFGLPGGEHFNSLNGQRGGLWRSRGMSCNTLFGIGFCAQGTGPGVSFRRTEASKDTKYSWMFAGIDGDIFGENGFGGGASGDEIDRYDVVNGSPDGVITLATSTGHSDDFGIAVEDLSFPAVNTLGTQTNLIRSDVVYYVGAGGGAVFGVGSINWYCSLGWDSYDNNVARLTANVIKGFLARG